MLFATAIYFALSDPVIQGVRLSEYLKQCEGCALTYGGSTSNGETISAPDLRPGATLDSEFDVLAQIEPRTWPLLVRALRGKESNLNRGLRWLAEKHKFFERFVREDRNASYARQLGAVLVIRYLGPTIDRAAPAIAKLVDDPDSALAATIALIHIQPKDERHILALTNVLKINRPWKYGSSPEFLHSAAILALGTFGSRASEAIPVLTNCFTSPNARVRAAAAVALARIGAPAETTVPLIVSDISAVETSPSSAVAFALSRGPFDRSYEDLVMSIWALGAYGEGARMALPVLSNFLHYPVVNAREAAQVAIRRITGVSNDAAR